NLAASFRVKPTKKTSMQLDYNAFWLSNTNDAWYRSNGSPRICSITPSAPSYVDSEIDLTGTYQPFKFLAFQAGYSHFFTGGYVRASGPDGDANFGYVQALVNF